MSPHSKFIPAIFAFTISLLPLPPVAQESDGWTDPSPHSSSLVSVEDGIQLEVLDWGGEGQAIILLAGLPATAHHFDDFAPMLAERHRVVGVNWRGFGRSSSPDGGYTFERLAEDVIAVVQALELADPIIVGHSFAGEVMHLLGARQASEFAGLVYIDAAFDRSDPSSDYDAKLRELPRDPAPQPGDFSSVTALQAFRTGNGMPPLPEAEIRNRFVVDSGGNISGPWQPPPAVQNGYTRVMRERMMNHELAPLGVPALALYAAPERPEDLMRPWYDAGDAVLRETVQQLFVLARERYQRHAKWFQSLAGDTAQVVAIPGAHDLFITHPAEVRNEIERFAASL